MNYIAICLVWKRNISALSQYEEMRSGEITRPVKVMCLLGWHSHPRVEALEGALHGLEAAQALHAFLPEAGLNLEYLSLINCGSQRFGVAPSQTVQLIKRFGDLESPKFKSIATHPGQVYSAVNFVEVQKAPVQGSTAYGNQQTTWRQKASFQSFCRIFANMILIPPDQALLTANKLSRLLVGVAFLSGSI